MSRWGALGVCAGVDVALFVEGVRGSSLSDEVRVEAELAAGWFVPTGSRSTMGVSAGAGVGVASDWTGPCAARGVGVGVGVGSRITRGPICTPARSSIGP
ncbi:hypothetical protein [Erythrobacter sp. KY5]|uniref:hypothetical protein n=1 Tax=Erythrobacter sp. KY5 TaxID=2011159 RepID=UPI0013A6C341|nr:hypothetical protein [Erythrobacter sp. KY5]